MVNNVLQRSGNSLRLYGKRRDELLQQKREVALLKRRVSFRQRAVGKASLARVTAIGRTQKKKAYWKRKAAVKFLLKAEKELRMAKLEAKKLSHKVRKCTRKLLAMPEIYVSNRAEVDLLNQIQSDNAESFISTVVVAREEHDDPYGFADYLTLKLAVAFRWYGE